MNTITEEKAAAALEQMGWVRSGDTWCSVAHGHHVAIPGPATAVLAMCMHGETDRSPN